MTILTDTNVLVAWINERQTPDGKTPAIIEQLLERGHRCAVVSQNLIELWSVCTRPTSVGGLGLDTHSAFFAVNQVEREFVRLADADQIYIEWKRQVNANKVSGRQVHDARLVASMIVHNITHILTFNGKDFTRYSVITVIDRPPYPPASKKLFRSASFTSGSPGATWFNLPSFIHSSS